MPMVNIPLSPKICDRPITDLTTLMEKDGALQLVRGFAPIETGLAAAARVNFNEWQRPARWRTKRPDRWLSRFGRGRDRQFSKASKWTVLPRNWLAPWKQ
jgi:hypothetical protein